MFDDSVLYQALMKAVLYLIPLGVFVGSIRKIRRGLSLSIWIPALIVSGAMSSLVLLSVFEMFGQVGLLIVLLLLVGSLK